MGLWLVIPCLVVIGLAFLGVLVWAAHAIAVTERDWREMEVAQTARPGESRGGVTRLG